ncbi:hypothetical protein OG625_20375 [Streptomyces sp. NBC_01351]|uniref:hypothetical protein n=1 Tax=Streptomyces sp. NBC_01351 TaxID=2903833 RepID=UPI002E32D94D|nr:hypothetical protein [Streptomyces sp. NBC_01351]
MENDGPPDLGGEESSRYFLAGIRGMRARKKIVLCERTAGGEAKEIWSWAPTAHRLRGLPDAVVTALLHGESVTEVRVADGGKKLAVLMGNAAMVLSYPSGEVYFATDCPGTGVHSLEVLPGNLLATADTGGVEAGLRIFSMNEPYTDEYQQITGLASCHWLLWDRIDGVVWAVGTNRWPNGSHPDNEVFGRVLAYRLQPENEQEPVSPVPVKDIALPRSQIAWEFAGGRDLWFDGPHVVCPVPGKRVFLIASDLGVREFDLTTQRQKPLDTTLTEYFGSAFKPTARQRDEWHKTGNPAGNRGMRTSNMKSLSVSEDGSLLYIQAAWKAGDFAKSVDVLDKGSDRAKGYPLGTVYKATWFQEVSGWETARI